MSPNSYPKYKDSGVDWLNDVPAHWHITPLGQHFTLRNVTVSDKDFVPLSVTMSGIVPQMENVAKTQNGDSRKLVRRGDFVINSRSDRKGSSGLSNYDGSVSQISIVLVPHRIAPKFTHHLLRSVPFQEEFYRFGTGIVADLWSTRFSAMKAIRLALPPISEQEAIAAYLDRETAEIDAFITDQKELLALLSERRTATITQAVTKGLNPNAPMKDSAIPWVGEIPEHWTVSRFSRCVRINSGQVDPKVLPFSEMYLIAPNHVESATGRLIELETASSQGADSGKYLVRAGQVIYSKIRPNLMKTVIAPINCLCSADMYGLEADGNQLSNKFLMYLLLSQPFHDYAVDQSMRVAMPKLNHDSLGAAPVWLPPQLEQVQIVEYIETELPEIDAAIADAREAISLSKERRAAVISAAVTGKIDVRGLVAPEANNVEGVSVGVA